jgi:hypothetical protein
MYKNSYPGVLSPTSRQKQRDKLPTKNTPLSMGIRFGGQENGPEHLMNEIQTMISAKHPTISKITEDLVSKYFTMTSSNPQIEKSTSRGKNLHPTNDELTKMLRLSKGKSPFDYDNFHSFTAKNRNLEGRSIEARTFKNKKIKDAENFTGDIMNISSPDKSKSKSTSTKKMSDYYKSTNLVRITDPDSTSKSMAMRPKADYSNKTQKKSFLKDYEDYYESVVFHILGKDDHLSSPPLKLCLKTSDNKSFYYEKSFCIKNMARRYVYFAIHTNEARTRLSEKELNSLKGDFLNLIQKIGNEVIV